MARPRLAAVIFDVDDTLFSTTRFARTARRAAVAALRRYGVRSPVSLLERELEETISEFGSNYPHHFEKLILRLPPGDLQGVHRSIVVAAAVAAYHDAKFTGLKPFPDVRGALKRMAGAGLRLGIVTDGLEFKQAEKLVRLRLAELFKPNCVIISDQIGISKPNPKIYLRACAAIGVTPSEAVYVGDHPLKDVDAAHAAGLGAILADRGGKHSKLKGATRPDAVVKDFRQLLRLLRSRYRVPLSTG